ncbi:protein translocase subunit SecD [Alicyclobacillus curvatus]|nr:protein translocase subunit SecD [Alicyclobacillus curvatus]
MKWIRIFWLLLVAASIVGVTVGTSAGLWKHTKLGLDLRGGYDLVYQIDSQGQALTASDKQAVLTAVQLRVDAAGIGSPNIQLEDQNRIDVQLAGTYSAQQANRIIGQTSQLGMYASAKVKTENGQLLPYTPQNAAIPNSTIVPSGPALVTGKDLKSNASYQQDPQRGDVVAVTFKNPGEWQFITTRYLGKTIYTFLGSQMINSARVTQITPNGQTEITGMTPQQCVLLAKELNAGALPYPLHLVSSTTVGPSLGALSLQTTMRAGLVALVLIFAFMMFVYRTAGVIANLSLIAYGYISLALFSGLGIVLTLPGLAALVLGIGMAVDANIISYERVIDELNSGKSLMSSVIAGNRRALRTIVDSNVTTFVAGIVMYMVGQGDIKGFAMALMLSVATSFLTSVFLSRTMLLQLAKTKILHSSVWFGFGKRRLQTR